MRYGITSSRSKTTDFGPGPVIILFIISLLSCLIPFIGYFFLRGNKNIYLILLYTISIVCFFLLIIIIVLLADSESKSLDNKLDNTSSQYSSEMYLNNKDKIKQRRKLGRVFYIILIIIEIIGIIAIFILFKMIKKLPPRQIDQLNQYQQQQAQRQAQQQAQYYQDQQQAQQQAQYQAQQQYQTQLDHQALINAHSLPKEPTQEYLNGLRAYLRKNETIYYTLSPAKQQELQALHRYFNRYQKY